MISNSLAFNDIEYLSKQIESSNTEGIFNFLSKYNNVIDFLKCIKQTAFSVSQYCSFTIEQGEIAISRDEFLTNIPEDKHFIYEFGELNFKISYPKVVSYSYERCLKTCIVDINNRNLTQQEIDSILSILPSNEYKKIINFIKENIVSRLNKIVILDTKSDKYKKEFVYNSHTIYSMLFYVCRYSIDYLQKIRLIMLKEANFSFIEFDRMTVEEINRYYKLLKQMYDRANE